jgi:hypothetical protein
MAAGVSSGLRRPQQRRFNNSALMGNERAMILMFSGLLLGCAWFCFASALEEYGDRQRWLAAAYTILGAVSAIGSATFAVWHFAAL